jgi:hypothetical protein
MNFIQTFRLHKQADPFQSSFGWLSPEYHLMGWALSCLQVKKFYNNITLYASTNTAKLLIDTLELPYTNVRITHDNIYMPDERLWALSKIHTYALQTQPFIHLDGDVFLFDKLPSHLLSAELVVQNIEMATGYYTSTQNELIRHFTFFPDCVYKDFCSGIPISAVNAGLLGGQHCTFINAYAETAVKYVSENVDHFSKLNLDRFNVFFEQHLFYSMAMEQEIPISMLLTERVKDNQYKDLSHFHTVQYRKNYLHLLGHYKRDKFTCLQMAATLRELYPEYYYRIISLCKKRDLKLFLSLYNGWPDMENDNYIFFHENSKMKYNEGLVGEATEPTTALPSVNINEIPELVYLQQVVHEFCESGSHTFSKDYLQKDLEVFFENLKQIINNTAIPVSYLYGRDLACIHWYPNLFKDESAIFEQVIEKCEDISLFNSAFDWAGLAKGYVSEGRVYYEQMEIAEGEFCNLVVPELTYNGFELFDIDETEKMVLDNLSEPKSIGELLSVLEQYVDDDVLQNNPESFEQLFIVQIQQLVLKKAVRPFLTNEQITSPY